MMVGSVPRSWRQEFEQAARDRRDDLAYSEKMRRSQTIERERDERTERREQERNDLVTATLAFAPPEDVAAFRVELDGYDAATVEALMDNQEAMDRVREGRAAMLNDATVLSDGRRVFKSRDGQHVFDEHGQKLAPDIVDPASIANTKTRWEPFKDVTDRLDDLRQERQALSAYQTRLDEARERLDRGEITVKELNAVKAELKTDMPAAVRGKLGLENADEGMEPRLDVQAVGLPNNMDALMRRTGLGPAPVTP